MEFERRLFQEMGLHCIFESCLAYLTHDLSFSHLTNDYFLSLFIFSTESLSVCLHKAMTMSEPNSAKCRSNEVNNDMVKKIYSDPFSF